MGKAGHLRKPLSEAELAQVPKGEQPEEDGLLVCLECGRWYRGLGGHVVRHGYSADEYRQQFELPRTRGLWAADAREGAGRRSKARAGKYPKAIETQLRGTPEERERALEAQRESARRAGTQLRKREFIEQRSALQRERTRQKYEELAKAAGYAGIDDFIEQTQEQPGVVLAELLGISVSAAKWLRRYHAADFNLEHHPKPPEPLTPEELAALVPGEQPTEPDWVLCRECGHWLKGLARHLTVKHSLTSADYRARHGLANDGPLMAPNAAEANVRSKRERLDRRARQHGYAGAADLIDKTRADRAANVAVLLVIDPATVLTLRKRYPPR
ncbi:MucR family transcriptional regulator [Nonomuraea sp. 10N515B]|uniref:MucR family transcriptional regulator n=1 Tax=Nonomuraea sp. 10N515B TaxID=3457422 RepID=UPI003FCD1218